MSSLTGFRSATVLHSIRFLERGLYAGFGFRSVGLRDCELRGMALSDSGCGFGVQGLDLGSRQPYANLKGSLNQKRSHRSNKAASNNQTVAHRPTRPVNPKSTFKCLEIVSNRQSDSLGPPTYTPCRRNSYMNPFRKLLTSNF